MTRWFLSVSCAVILVASASFALAQAGDHGSGEVPVITEGPPDDPVGGGRGIANGPDVTVYDLYNIGNFGEDGGIYGYSVGTLSCNQGTQPVNWCDEPGGSGCAPGATDADHPVIAQNLFRLEDGRFEQIGMSWLKHGFLALTGSAPNCGDGSCDPPPFGGNQLGVGCTDPYGSGLNGSRPLGMRSEVDASTGEFPFPYTTMSWSTVYDQRIKVDGADVDPAQNPGAKYWVEGQYVTADDAQQGNGLNNASYREVTVSAGTFNLSLSGATHREQSALYAWKAVDPDVEIVNADVSDTHLAQRFEAARAVRSGGGVYHYEMAVRNMNADVSARGLEVSFPGPVVITNAGFHDVDHHSGEPYVTTDWTIDVDGAAGTIRWFGEDFASNQNANALRWGTTFTFWFDATRSPVGTVTTLELFKPAKTQFVDVPFTMGTLFDDGFESGNTSAWSVVSN